jgi:hypothetical protein
MEKFLILNLCFVQLKTFTNRMIILKAYLVSN